MHKLFEQLKYSGHLGFHLSIILFKFYKYLKYNRFSDKKYLEKIFYKNQGYKLNLRSPLTLNEKLQWLKIYDRRRIATIHADKYLVRDYIAKEFGEEYLIPLILVTDNPTSIKYNDLPNEAFVIKSNHSSGDFKIVRDKKSLDFKRLIVDCKWWLSFNYFYPGRQWQYKDIPPLIIIEKMLQTKEGKIPNDYKFHCINGKVEFIYVSVDREGVNKRNIYDSSWAPLLFTFSAKTKQEKGNIRGAEIDPPKSFSKMLIFAEKISKLYAYVRIDFYDIDGKLYFGEITHHHGGGFDQFRPIECDYKFGNLLDLNYINLKN
jgi:hypothetical protein